MSAAMGSKQPPSGSSAENQPVPRASNGSPPLEEVKSLSVERLIPPKFSQPRRYFDETQMQKLVSSVREFGIIQPLLVRPMGDKYEIVAGERRYRAALAVGLNSIAVIVRILNDTEALECALMENLQRCDLNPVDETEGILRLLELSLDTDSAKVISLLNQMANHKRGLTDNVIRKEEREAILSVFQSMGRLSPESFRTNRLPLLNLPEAILEALRQGRIEYTKAKTIARLQDEQFREELLEEAIAQALSLSQIKERIRKHQVLEQNELLPRIEAITKKIKKIKVWDEPDKQDKIEYLLRELEAVLSKEEN